MQSLKEASEPCSAGDISALRHRFYLANYVADIARVVDGRVRCSAVWGVWEMPHTLSAGISVGNSGISVWKNIKNPILSELTGDLAASNTVAVFTSISSFEELGGPSGKLHGRIYTTDRKYVYQDFGDTQSSLQLPNMSSWWNNWFLRSQTVVTCDAPDNLDICAESTIVTDMRSPIAQYGLLGALIGAVFGMILLLWWKGSHGLRAGLLEALQKRRIHVVYQPLRVLETNEVVGAEALARWTHQEVGPIPPTTFIGWIEKLGLRAEFTRYVVVAALDGALGRLRGRENFYVSINVFPGDLEDASFLDFMTDETARRGIDPARVVLEISESAQFSTPTPNDILQLFRARGFRIFLDDFGVGYSNFGNVVSWKLDGIKLDRVFIQSIGETQRAAPVMEKIIEMARQLDVQVIVEGIETQAQADYILDRMPHAVGQGWLTGRPGSALDAI